MPKTFDIRITRDQFELRKQELRNKEGIHVQGDAGEVSGHGVKVAYSYDKASNILTLEILDKPMLATNSLVEARLRDWFGSV